MAYLEDDSQKGINQPLEPRDLSDEELLVGSLQNPNLYAELIKRYRAPFMRKAMSILHDQAMAEEAVQDAFTRMYLYARKFRPGVEDSADSSESHSFRAWGYKILVNTALTLYQKRRKIWDRQVSLEPEEYEAIPDSTHFSVGLEAADVVLDVFSRIPEHFARILRLQFLEDKPQEEIARIENLSMGAVKTRVHRAKRAFAAALRREPPKELPRNLLA